MADLAHGLSVTSGAVSQTIDGLVEAGLVTSAVNPADRRGRIISLTDSARADVAAFEKGYLNALAPRFDALTTEQIVQLDRILAAINSPSDAA